MHGTYATPSWRAAANRIVSPLVVVAALVALAACGDGGGDREIVRLGVGYRGLDGDNMRGFIVRNVGDGWVSVGEDVLDDRAVTTVVFASRDVAWAYGRRLLRSMDAGRTWVDVEASFDLALGDRPHALTSAAFADATTGYLATYSVDSRGFPLLGPFVWVTRDGGDSWSAVELERRPQEVGFTLGVRSGVAELLRHAVAVPGAIVEPIDGAHFTVQTVATSPATIHRGFDAVGERSWIAFAVIHNDDVAQSRPTVFTSARPGDPYAEQALPPALSADFGPIDMCDERVGLVGGVEFGIPFAPIVFHTDDGGQDWQRSVLRGIERDFELADVLCVQPSEIYAATKSFFAFKSALFESGDGGRNFDRVAIPFEDRSQLTGLASNAGR